MSHLSRDERLLALDDALDAPRRAHLASCPACRLEVESLASVVARVKAVDVPEPSPLFWDHLAARVGDAIAREPAPERPAWWAPRPRWGLAAAAAALVAVLAGYTALRSPEVVPGSVAVTGPVTTAPGTAGRAPAAAETAVATTAADVVEMAGDDEGWRLIAAMADGADLEPLMPAAGRSELTIAGLSAEERAALIRELEAALAERAGRKG